MRKNNDERISITKSFACKDGTQKEITIAYRINNSWSSLEESREAVTTAGYNPDKFGYVNILGCWYPVTMINNGKQIVLAKERRCFIRNVIYVGPHHAPLGWEAFVNYNRLCQLPIVKIDRPRVYESWKTEILDDLTKINGREVEYIFPNDNESVNWKKQFRNNSIVLVGTTLFSTNIRKEDLEVCELYFKYTDNVYRDVEENGYIKYNPFTSIGVKDNGKTDLTRLGVRMIGKREIRERYGRYLSNS